ncbi:alpha/beta-hydrolase [Daedalea quercina L-15889]|uniref:Alpha/beta-hydrolase n=1 Tax=Daedalea quercina L-15889 TaxID=1314783 RepID=A0A165KUD3_9APHY|nr:alpha/beta-hydrolase [Daedalea quercina L-15889]
MQTATYSHVGSLDIKVDFQVPPSVKVGVLPGVIFFHGGGMVAGSRHEYFPWMPGSAHGKGMIFFTADYRLIHPSTGFDIIDDIRRLFAFLADPSFSKTYLPNGISLDPTRLAVMAASGGGYPARAAALYAQPKPKAVFLLYGMGGKFLGDHWLAAKDPTVTLGPRDRLVDDETAARIISEQVSPVADSPIIAPQSGDFQPGPRSLLFRHWWRTGELLDHVLGEPVSADLRVLSAADRLAAVPAHLRPALLEAQYDGSFPPTFLLHGGADTTVPLEESQATFDTLRKLGVAVEMEVVPGGPHGLLVSLSPIKYAPGAEEAQERGMIFLARYLSRSGAKL